MSIMTNQLATASKVVNFISSPITEMICAFIIDISRSFIFTFIYQFTGDQLIYPILQYLIIFIPWIMLGHGALRNETSRFKGNISSPLESLNSSTALVTKKYPKLVSFLFIVFVFLQFFHF